VNPSTVGGDDLEDERERNNDVDKVVLPYDITKTVSNLRNAAHLSLLDEGNVPHVDVNPSMMNKFGLCFGIEVKMGNKPPTLSV